MRQSFRTGALSAFILSTIMAIPVSAENRKDFESVKGVDEAFRIDVGGFFQKFTTTIRVDSATHGIGTTLDLEDDLGLKGSQANLRVDGYWRFGRRSRLDFAVLNWNRTSSHHLAQDIQVGDDIFHAGASLYTRLRVYDAEAYYTYSVFDTPKYELGLMIGVSTLVNTVRVGGQATVSGTGGSGSTSFDQQSRNLVAPIPALGAHFRYTIFPGYFFTARFKGFDATVARVNGSLLDWKAGLDWFPWKRVGFGVSYARTQIMVKKKSDPSAQLDYRYSGPMGYLSFVF